MTTLTILDITQDREHWYITVREAGKGSSIVYMGDDLRHAEHAINRFKKQLREGYYEDSWQRDTIVVDGRDMKPQEPEIAMTGHYLLQYYVNGVVVESTTGPDGLALLQNAHHRLKPAESYTLIQSSWNVYATLRDAKNNLVARVDGLGDVAFV
jgi:hypothetical protein